MSLFTFSLYCATMLNHHINVTQADMAVDYMVNLNLGPQPEYKKSHNMKCRRGSSAG